VKLIIPIAGLASRMRPHTFTTIKPLIPIAGVTIIERLINEALRLTDGNITKIGYVVNLGIHIDNLSLLLEITNKFGIDTKIFYQDQPMGTAHSVFCAGDFLDGQVIIAFGDTIFACKEKLNLSKDALVLTKRVENPREFGVVVADEHGKINRFVEKPRDFVSKEAIIGVYYIKEGKLLKQAIKHVISNAIIRSKEYQLTDALEIMKNDGVEFYLQNVEQWLDCGNKDAVLTANRKILAVEYSPADLENKLFIDSTNSCIIPPVFIDANVTLSNSVIGPYVSIHQGVSVCDSRISNSIIRHNATITNAVLNNSIIGSHSNYLCKPHKVSIGDYSMVD
jgi:glucose-1-phosphate thymidylyltransferase